MDFVRVASVQDVTAGHRSRGGQGAEAVADAGRWPDFAAQRKCPHLGFNLCRENWTAGRSSARSHKAKFDLASGAIERDPKLLFLALKAKTDLAVYPVKLQGGEILGRCLTALLAGRAIGLIVLWLELP